jgi:uncharacterized protein (DUF488 family)
MNRPALREASRRVKVDGMGDDRSEVYTIGHSTRSVEALIGLLRAHRVECLFDVRRYPGSRRNPQFGQPALERSLGEAGIAYVHEPDLGGRRRPAKGSPNAFWENDQFRGYADHMADPAFNAAVSRVVAAGRRAPVVVMCAELHPSRCHRRMLADALLLRGAAVTHIIDADRDEPHQPPAAMREAPGGHPVYPSPEQLELWDGPSK